MTDQPPLKIEESYKALIPVDFPKIFKRLINEINWGNLPKTNKILNDYPHLLDHRDKNGRTPLIYAVLKEKIDIIKLLTDRNCDMEMQDNSGMTALLLSASLGQLEICKLLLDKGSNIKSKDNEGLNVLLHGINSYKIPKNKNKDFELLRTFLEKDKSLILEKDNQGNTPMIFAVMLKNNFSKELAEFLEKYALELIAGIQEDLVKDNNSTYITEIPAIVLHSKNGDAIITISLQGNESNINLNSNTAVISPKNQAHIANKLGQTAITIALEQGNIDLVKYLLQLSKKNNVNYVIELVDSKNYNLLPQDSIKSFALNSEENHKSNDALNLIKNFKIINSQNSNEQNLQQFFIVASDLGVIEIVRYCVNECNVNIDSLDFDRNTALIKAAANGHFKVVEFLIEQGANKEVKGQSGATALIKASANGHYAVVKFLINQGVNKEIKDQSGATALIKASANGHYKVVKFLINQGVNKNIQDEEGFTALIFAVKNNHVPLVQYLISVKELNPDLQDSYKDTALMLAISEDKIKIVAHLLNIKTLDLNIKNEDGDTALLLAVRNNKIDIVKLLVQKENIDLNIKNEDGDTALLLAVRNNKIDIVKLLVQKENIDLNIKNEDGDTALLLAVRDKRVDIVARLVKKANIDPNIQDQDGYSPLMLAIKANQVKIFGYLLSVDYIEINQIYDKYPYNHYTSLHFAACKGHVEIVKLLLDNSKIEANRFNGDGLTPLHIAVSKNYTELVPLLVNNKKIQINEKSVKDGLTALHIAANNNLLNILKILIKNKEIDINAQSYKTKLTSLHISVAKGYTDIVKAIVEHKDTNLLLKDQFSNNALMMAVAECNKNIVDLLIDTGTYSQTINERNTQGLTLYVLSTLKKCAAKDSQFNDNLVKKGAKATSSISKKLIKELYDCNDDSVDAFCNELVNASSISRNDLTGFISTYNLDAINHTQLSKHKVIQTKFDFDYVGEDTTSMIGEDANAE